MIVCVLLCALFLLLLSALFSGTETAVFAYDRLKARQLASQGRGPLAYIYRHLDLFLACCLFLNLLANAGLNVLATQLTAEYAGEVYLPLMGLLTTACILIFSEITPKVLAVRHASFLARLGSVPLAAAMVFLRPIIAGMVAACQFLRRHTPWKPLPHLLPEELRTAVVEAVEKGELSQLEGAVLDNMIVFRERQLRSLMTPRTDIVYLPRHTPRQEAVQRIRQARFTRLPVTDTSDIDSVIGSLHVKEFLTGEHLQIEDVIRPVYFAPECMRAGDLFRELSERGISLAMVVDEYGNVAGLVSVHDLVEELLGENPDEYSPPAPWVARRTAEGWVLNGTVRIDVINRHLGLDLPVGRDQTLGGFLLRLFGHLPKRGESVRWGNSAFTVQVVRRRRIAVVKLKRLEKA